MKQEKRKSIIAVVCIVCLAFMVSACSAPVSQNEGAPDVSEKTIVLKAGHGVQTDHAYHKGITYFADLVKEKTNGRVEIQVFPAAQLGGERDLIEGLQLGTIDISLTAAAPVSNFSNDLLVLDMPYLFRDTAHAHKVLDGEIGQGLYKNLEKIGVKGLVFFESGFFLLQNNVKEIVHPEDCKGMKIRTMENEPHMEWVRSLGASPTPMAMGEVYTALQNKTVDGHINSIGIMYTSKFYQPGPYFTMAQMVYCASPVLMSLKTWESLPADIQEIIMECAIEARGYARECNRKHDEELLDKMISEGVKVTEVDINEWKEASFEYVYNKMVPSKIDPELIEKILAVK